MVVPKKKSLHHALGSGLGMGTGSCIVNNRDHRYKAAWNCLEPVLEVEIHHGFISWFCDVFIIYFFIFVCCFHYYK